MSHPVLAYHLSARERARLEQLRVFLQTEGRRCVSGGVLSIGGGFLRASEGLEELLDGLVLVEAGLFPDDGPTFRGLVLRAAAKLRNCADLQRSPECYRWAESLVLALTPAPSPSDWET